jgi:hypothetical protein
MAIKSTSRHLLTLFAVIGLMTGAYQLQRYFKGVEDLGYDIGEVVSTERVFKRWGAEKYLLVRLSDATISRVAAGQTGNSLEIGDAICLRLEKWGGDFVSQLSSMDKCTAP